MTAPAWGIAALILGLALLLGSLTWDILRTRRHPAQRWDRDGTRWVAQPDGRWYSPTTGLVHSIAEVERLYGPTTGQRPDTDVAPDGCQDCLVPAGGRHELSCSTVPHHQWVRVMTALQDGGAS